jgi:hypothetical protein
MTGGGHDGIKRDVMIQKKGSIRIIRNVVGESGKAWKKMATIIVIRDDVMKRTITQQSARDIETRDIDNTRMKAE